MLIVIVLFLIFFNTSLCNENPHQDVLTIFRTYLPHEEILTITSLCGGTVYDEKFVVTTKEKSYVVKIFGNLSPNPIHELKAHLIAAKKGIAPHIYFNNSNIIIMDFIPGGTLSFNQAKEPCVLYEMANTIRIIGNIQEEFAHKDVLGEIKEKFKQIKAGEFLHSLLMQAQNKFDDLEHSITIQNKPLIFCYGDLHPRNIFFANEKITLIDWSDGGMCLPFFDLAEFSVFCCLTENNDIAFLTHYLQKAPTENDTIYFRCMKKIVRIYDALNLLVYLQNLNVSLMNDVSPRDFSYLQKIWSDNSALDNNNEFLYELACSQLQEFLKLP